MIVRSHRVNAFKLLVACQGSIVPAITWKILAAASIGVVATLIHLGHVGSVSREAFKFTMGPFTSLGVALSLFLGFYNNSSYSRWWEARGYWGRQIIIIRDLARFLMLLESDGSFENGREYCKTRDGCNSSCCQLEASGRRPRQQKSQSDNSISEQSLENFDADGRDIEMQGGDRTENEASPCPAGRQPTEALKTDISNFDYSQGFPQQDWIRNLIRLSVAQTHALRFQLRPYCKFDGSNTALDDRNRFLTKFEQHHIADVSRNPANAILLHASRILGMAYRQSQMYQHDRKTSEKDSRSLDDTKKRRGPILLDSYTMVHISKHIELLCSMQTSCERIHNTPVPLAYSLLIQRTTVLYVTLLPFAIADAMGWWTPVFTAIVAYTFFGLDELARQIQEPFRDEPMCLALSGMSRVCEIDALEAMGEPTPPPLKRQGKILM